MSAWEYYNREDAIFRRPAGRPGGVTDVLHGEEWKPYAGDRTAAYLEGDRIEDPLAKAMGDGGEDESGAAEKPDALAKAAAVGGRVALLLKAQIPGGAMGDMFGAVPVPVRGHTTKSGVTVKPHMALRHKGAPKLDVTALKPQPLPLPQEPQADVAARQLAEYTAANPASVLAKPATIQPTKHLDAPSDDAKHFYVSAIDGPRKHLVAGPYSSHDEAKGMVDHVRKHADSDPRAHFMAWGTAGSATPLKTPLGSDWKPAE